MKEHPHFITNPSRGIPLLLSNISTTKPIFQQSRHKSYPTGFNKASHGQAKLPKIWNMVDE
ncbi:hypothetical protein [Legionella antarctica]|uniref:hypothetical protein n=1 Tax=Legionella antarctica TaxID=2708020 RepID=UPI001563C44A|nr:hypothetical protein [Legionella antarctica]